MNIKKLMKSSGSAQIIIRMMIGLVFLSEGIQKFLFPDRLGIGRFTEIGIPYPDLIAPFVGVVEIVCGSFLIIGLFTRLATIPLLIDISVAILSTKVPILFAKGFWPMVHEARTDFCMLLGGLYFTDTDHRRICSYLGYVIYTASFTLLRDED